MQSSNITVLMKVMQGETNVDYFYFQKNHLLTLLQLFWL
jgi:hypothetical protein